MPPETELRWGDFRAFVAGDDDMEDPCGAESG